MVLVLEYNKILYLLNNSLASDHICAASRQFH